jgi:hypothetical protein
LLARGTGGQCTARTSATFSSDTAGEFFYQDVHVLDGDGVTPHSTVAGVASQLFLTP